MKNQRRKDLSQRTKRSDVRDGKIILVLMIAVVVIAYIIGMQIPMDKPCPDQCARYINSNASTWQHRTPEFYSCLSTCESTAV